MFAIAAPSGAPTGEEGLQRASREDPVPHCHHVNSTMLRAVVGDLPELDPRQPRGHLHGLRRCPGCPTIRASRRGRRREPVHRQGRPIYMSLRSLRAHRHHPRLHPRDRARGSARGRHQAPDLGDDIYLADEVLHRHRRRGHPDPRARRPPDPGEGRRGPVTEKIQTRFFDVVNGRAPEYAHWLAHV